MISKAANFAELLWSEYHPDDSRIMDCDQMPLPLLLPEVAKPEDWSASMQKEAAE